MNKFIIGDYVYHKIFKVYGVILRRDDERLGYDEKPYLIIKLLTSRNSNKEIQQQWSECNCLKSTYDDVLIAKLSI